MARKLLTIGLAGSILSGLCCFTPLLPATLGALGATSLLGILYNDAILLPALTFFLILTGVALWQMRRNRP